MKPQTRLVLPDVHFPFQDDDLLEAWLEYLKAWDFQGVDIIGDVLDCYTLSRFDKNPLRKTNIQEEVDEARSFLERVREAAPDADIRFSEGNHENRLKRTLWGRAKELAPIRGLDIPQLLDLKSLGIRYYRPESPYQIGKLVYLHGDVTRKQNFSKSAGGRAADAVARAVGNSVIMGHTHQMGYAPFRSWDKLVEGYEVGCLCRFDLEYIIGVPPWHQGWAEVAFTHSGAYRVDFTRVFEDSKGRTICYPNGTPSEFIPLGRSKSHLGG